MLTDPLLKLDRVAQPLDDNSINDANAHIPDTLEPEIYVIMAIPLKCVAALFRSPPEGKSRVLSGVSDTCCRL